MLPLGFFATLAVIAGYLACRAFVVARLRVEAPDLLERSNDGTPSAAALLGITLSDPLLDLLEREPKAIDPASPIWRYVKAMRICIVALVFIWVVGPFVIFWPGSS